MLEEQQLVYCIQYGVTDVEQSDTENLKYEKSNFIEFIAEF
jgi:hypothetical protein